WHPSTQKGGDPGHGVNATYDLSRGAAGGGTSFYFGLEQSTPGSTSGGGLPFESNGQLGILVDDFQSDLTSNALIGANYNLPGGAYGSLITDAFDLTTSAGTIDIDDRPNLYFNYFLETENVDAAVMQDSARVFITNDDGMNWSLLTTNNTPLAAGIPTGTAASEIPFFQSHSRLANVSDDRQRVQGLFDTAEWRQARVDLSDFVGQTDLKLRFDFSTAGTITDPDVTNNDPTLGTHLTDAAGTVTVDAAGDLNAVSRGQNNQFEGFYIDDIIIGFSERGEMITGATANQNQFTVPQPDPSLMLPEEILSGDYQVEIRRGFEYAASVSQGAPEITIGSTFDTNARFIPGSPLGLDPVVDDFDMNDMDPATFGFDPAAGWAPNSNGSTSPWFVNAVAQAPATTLTAPLDGATLMTTITVADASVFPTAGTPFLLVVGDEPMGAAVLAGNTITVVRDALLAVPHIAGDVASNGTFAAQSGPVSDNQFSAMQVVQTSTSVTFDYRVDADEGDAFRVYVDHLNGEEGPVFESSDTGGAFATTTIDVTPGLHTFYFVYQKDSQDTPGNPLEKANAIERVLIDNVSFTGLGDVFVRGDRNLERVQGHFQIES
ncbi:MAG: hypothetical protein VB858_08580, partial [Planctomycetaceae bacterium]